MGILGKLIVATGYEKLPKVQQITQSGHNGRCPCFEPRVAPTSSALTQSLKPVVHGALYYKEIDSQKVKAWSSLDKGESLTCQITSPFNKKIGCFCKAIILILLSKTTRLLLNGELFGKPVTPL